MIVDSWLILIKYFFKCAIIAAELVNDLAAFTVDTTCVVV